MCGITGFWNAQNNTHDTDLHTLIKLMSDEILLRGPDSGDQWLDAKEGLALGHRRLSIIDLSPAGNQPMLSACGRYVIVYNGEVYNSDELRADLSKYDLKFRGYSDTEAILESCAKIGLKATVEKLIGMFAFALWDRETKSLSLVRDRLGIKPLYWADYGGDFIFASELKSLVKHPSFEKEINFDAVASYLRHSYVPAPYSIYQNVQKLRPGEILTRTIDGKNKIEPYWSLENVVEQSRTNPWQGGDQAAIDELETLLKDSVKRRMVSDVPLGAFLSGGIDSSLVTSLMQAQSRQNIKTFSIGFEEDGFNEAPHARAVADHLGTDHTELYVTSQVAQDVVPKLAHIFDEPFADSSQIPTYLVSEMTKKHVTVALSGDGGDELFCGYSRYFNSAQMSEKIFCYPAFLRKTGAKFIHSLSPKTWDKLAKLIPASKRPDHFGDKLHKLAPYLSGKPDDLFIRLLSCWENPEKFVRNGQEIETLLFDDKLTPFFPVVYDRMQYIDTLMYLPDDILTKVDRASMAVSLEARVPLLDHRVVEFSWRLPHSLKVRNNSGKWILKELLYNYVPKEIIDRPKMGFGVPVGDWIKGPMREWAEDLLSAEKLNKHQLVQTQEVRKRWQEHIYGERNWQAGLWNILMLQAWAEEWG